MRIHILVVAFAPAFLSVACGDGSSTSTGGTGGNGGAGASGGSGGSGGTGGSGATGGSGGSGGTGAVGGSGGSGGAGGSGGSGGSGGTGGAGGGGDCTWAEPDPCGPGQFCDAMGCGAGTCVPVGSAESGQKAPACGCDGVTYWNASVAASHGMAVAAGGECAVPMTCGGIAALECPMGTSCNYELPNKGACAALDFAGQCWGMPEVCEPGVGFGPQTRACGADLCTDECELIKQDVFWHQDNTCPQ